MTKNNTQHDPAPLPLAGDEVIHGVKDGGDVRFTPADIVAGLLAKTSNLADLADAGAARTNLGLGTAATTAATAYDPAGTAAGLAAALSSSKVDKATMDANSVLYAVTNDTPAALAMGASTILARLAAGNIVAATPAQLKTLLAIAIGDVGSLQASLDAKIAGVRVEDEGSSTVAVATALNFVGSGVAVTDAGSGEATVTIAGGSGGVRVEDEGSSIVSAAASINFVGPGVSVSDAGSNEATVVIATPASAGAVSVGTPGGVDDTALVTTARAAAGVGGTIIFTSGTYVVDSVAASVANQHWIVMPRATVKLKNASDAPVIDVTADGVTIDGGGTLDGNRANQSDATTGVNSCVRIVSRSRVKVRDLVMRDSLSHCVYIDASSKVQVRNNEISGCGPAGNQKQVLVYDNVGSSFDIRISGNTVDSSGSANGCIAVTMHIDGRTAHKIRITGNDCIVGDHASEATLGIELFTGDESIISDVKVNNNDVQGPSSAVDTDLIYGISIGGVPSAAGFGIDSVTVANNGVRYCPAAAIELVGNGVACSANTCTASGPLSVNAVNTPGGLVGVTITANTLLDSVHLAYAMLIAGGAEGLIGPVVSGNTISGAAAASVILVDGIVTGANISDNTVTGCAGVPLNLSGATANSAIFTNSTVADNIFDLTGVGGTIDGILLGSTAVADVGITGNAITGATRSGIHGLVATSDITVENNRIKACQDGIKAEAAQTRWTVVGNKVRSCTDRGLIFSVASTDLLIEANAISDNPGGDYFTTGSTFLTPVVNGSGG